MDLPQKLLEVLKTDGVVAIATLGPDGPHMVNTWNQYIRMAEDGRMLIPAGYMRRTEANLAANISWGSYLAATVAGDPSFSITGNSVFRWNNAEGAQAHAIGYRSAFSCPEAVRAHASPPLITPVPSGAWPTV